jgi:hypothetical protein
VFEPIVIWDLEDDPDGNLAHIAEHGITQDEVEEVVGDPGNKSVPSDSSGRPLTFGWTSTGRYIGVVWEHVCSDPSTIKPVTAFDAPPPAKKAKKRKKR